MSVSEALRAATLAAPRRCAPPTGADGRGRYADIVALGRRPRRRFAWSYGLKPRRVWRGGEPGG